MAILTREQAADLRERIATAARGLLETDYGRAELLALTTEINALAEEARARAQFNALQMNRGSAPKTETRAGREADRRDDDPPAGIWLP